MAAPHLPRQHLAKVGKPYLCNQREQRRLRGYRGGGQRLSITTQKETRKLTKRGEAAVTGAEETVATEREPEAELPVALKLLPEVVAPEPAKKTRGKGKNNGNGNSEQRKLSPSPQLPPSLQLPPSVLSPSVLPIDPSAPSLIIPQPPKGSQRRLIMPHHGVLMSTNGDKEEKQALRVQ
ncbi:hypothetical protein Dimus_020187 [Dionaea muscipula]